MCNLVFVLKVTYKAANIYLIQVFYNTKKLFVLLKKILNYKDNKNKV